MTIHIERETDTDRIERCDHEGTTEPLGGLASVSVCIACNATWPTRFGVGAATVRVVVKASTEGQGWRSERPAAVVAWLHLLRAEVAPERFSRDQDVVLDLISADRVIVPSRG